MDKKALLIVAFMAAITIAGFAAYAYKDYLDRVVSSTPSTSTNNSTPPQATPPPTDKDVNGCYTPDNVRNHYGEDACVDYHVAYTYEDSAGTQFIDQLSDYTSGFVGYVPAGLNIDLSQLQNKNIKVSGMIVEYGGYPEIQITSLKQVKIYTN